ncbi:MAG: hypothetical protein AAFZ89_06995 [Bacteroidota bacterium]
MKKVCSFLFILLVILSLNSCSIDDGPNFNFVSLQIVSAELPEAFDINQTHEIRVTYLRPNGCTAFEGFDIGNPAATVRNVVAIGSSRTDQVCEQSITEVDASFQFVALFSETYVFRFWTGEDADGNSQFLEIEVPVNNIPTN